MKGERKRRFLGAGCNPDSEDSELMQGAGLRFGLGLGLGLGGLTFLIDICMYSTGMIA